MKIGQTGYVIRKFTSQGWIIINVEIIGIYDDQLWINLTGGQLHDVLLAHADGLTHYADAIYKVRYSTISTSEFYLKKEDAEKELEELKKEKRLSLLEARIEALEKKESSHD